MGRPYELKGPSNYPNSHIGVFLGPMDQHEKVYDFMGVKELDESYDYHLRFRVETTEKIIRKYDSIQINTPISFLFSEKIISLLQELCPEQIQMFDTVIECKDGVITDYKAVNILNEVDVSDPERSKYKRYTKDLDPEESIYGYEWGGFVMKEELLEPIHICRDKPSSRIIISSTLKEALEKAKVKGCKYGEGD
jgi:hypothetical protein